MIIENETLLKDWIEFKLTIISDTDPRVLARYVLGLVKQEKPKEELKLLCYDHLDRFLQDKTRGFVDNLFECLESIGYLEFDLVQEAEDLMIRTLYPMEFPF